MSDAPLILVIEAERELAELIAWRAAAAGFQPLRVRSGDAAHRLARERYPVALVLDPDTPLHDGRTTLRRFAADRRLSPLPITVISRGTISRQEALRCGARDYFQKPFPLTQLFGSVAEQIDLAKRRKDVLSCSDSVIRRGLWRVNRSLQTLTHAFGRLQSLETLNEDNTERGRRHQRSGCHRPATEKTQN